MPSITARPHRKHVLAIGLLALSALLLPLGVRAQTPCANPDAPGCGASTLENLFGAPPAPSEPAAAPQASEQPMQLVRATKRKARQGDARPQRDRKYWNSTGIKEGAETKTPVIDFTQPTAAPPRDNGGSVSIPPASLPDTSNEASTLATRTGTQTMAASVALPAATSPAGAPPAVLAQTDTNADTNAETKTEIPAAATASDSSATPAKSDMANDMANDMAHDMAGVVDSSWQSLRAAFSDTYASLTGDGSEQPSDRKASLVGRIFIAIGFLLTAASAVRLLMA